MAQKIIKSPVDDNSLNSANHNFTELYNMKNALQTQINDLVLDAGKSDQEVAQARGGHKVLADRLNETDSQLANKANKDEVSELASGKADIIYVNGELQLINEKINSLDGLEFKGGFDTLQQLENAYPNGTSGLFVVGDYWYYWNASDGGWSRGNKLETTPWADFTTTQDEEWVV